MQLKISGESKKKLKTKFEFYNILSSKPRACYTPFSQLMAYRLQQGAFIIHITEIIMNAPWVAGGVCGGRGRGQDVVHQPHHQGSLPLQPQLNPR